LGFILGMVVWPDRAGHAAPQSDGIATTGVLRLLVLDRRGHLDRRVGETEMNIKMMLELVNAAETLAAFYNTLVKNGVPKDAALEMTLAAMNGGKA
jgi:hypothetical protein